MARLNVAVVLRVIAWRIYMHDMTCGCLRNRCEYLFQAWINVHVSRARNTPEEKGLQGKRLLNSQKHQLTHLALWPLLQKKHIRAFPSMRQTKFACSLVYEGVYLRV